MGFFPASQLAKCDVKALSMLEVLHSGPWGSMKALLPVGGVIMRERPGKGQGRAWDGPRLWLTSSLLFSPWLYTLVKVGVEKREESSTV